MLWRPLVSTTTLSGKQDYLTASYLHFGLRLCYK